MSPSSPGFRQYFLLFRWHRSHCGDVLCPRLHQRLRWQTLHVDCNLCRSKLFPWKVAQFYDRIISHDYQLLTSFLCLGDQKLSLILLHVLTLGSVTSLGLAFSMQVRCLVFLIIPQIFSKQGRYYVMFYTMIIILQGLILNDVHA